MTLGNVLDIIFHINHWLSAHHGPIVYAVMFILVFCETGLFFTPFLPGDSLIFAVGALCPSGGMSIWLSALVFIVAGVCGDFSNYNIGKALGPRIFRNEDVRFLNRKYLNRAHAFYEKYGAWTVFLGHFFPVIRTFVPFVAGMGSMSLKKFLPSNILGVTVWVSLFLTLGYFIGSLKFVQDNFGIVEILIIAISCIPAITVFLKERHASRKEKTEKQ